MLRGGIGNDELYGQEDDDALFSGDAELEGRVIAVEHLGGETYIYLDRPDAGTPMVIKAAGDARARVDDLMPVGVPAAACYLFDAQGRAIAPAHAVDSVRASQRSTTTI